jgi:NDP-sugar pyrophosphorylase family protein
MRTKTRLTITLSEDLVSQLDALVDGSSVKNRSNAIETILKDSLSPTVRTAIILAGGASEKDDPALLKIGGDTLLAYTLSLLKKHHIQRVIIALNKNRRLLMKTFGDGSRFDLKIEYNLEDKPLGTGGAVKKALPMLGNAPFLVIHSDVLTTINLTELFAFHFGEKSLATIAVKPRMSEPKYGQVFIQGNKIARFLEQGAKDGISIINTGVYVFDPKIFAVFPARARFTLEKDIFPILAEKQQLSASFFQGIWYDVTTPASYQEAAKRWREISAARG